MTTGPTYRKARVVLGSIAYELGFALGLLRWYAKDLVTAVREMRR